MSTPTVHDHLLAPDALRAALAAERARATRAHVALRDLLGSWAERGALSGLPHQLSAPGWAVARACAILREDALSAAPERPEALQAIAAEHPAGPVVTRYRHAVTTAEARRQEALAALTDRPAVSPEVAAGLLALYRAAVAAERDAEIALCALAVQPSPDALAREALWTRRVANANAALAERCAALAVAPDAVQDRWELGERDDPEALCRRFWTDPEHEDDDATEHRFTVTFVPGTAAILSVIDDA